MWGKRKRKKQTKCILEKNCNKRKTTIRGKIGGVESTEPQKANIQVKVYKGKKERFIKGSL